MDLTARQFFLYLRQIPKLASIKQLKQFEVSLLPHMKSFDRRSVIDNYRKIVIPVEVSGKAIDASWDALRKKRCFL